MTFLFVLPVDSQTVNEWRGSGRTGIYSESSLLKSWPAAGPSLLWESTEAGTGYSSVTVTGDVVYITGRKGDDDYLTAYTQDGKVKWSTRYGKSSDSNYPDTRSTPTYSNGRLYLVSGSGDMVCIGTDGKIVWSVNYFQKYNASAPRFGISESPVVVDNNVRAMAIGERFFGAGRDVESLVFVYGRIGVGAGLIFKGEVVRGSTTGAGEIGHTVMLLEGGELCRCGNRGCLETLVSEPAILRQAQVLVNAQPNSLLAQLNAQQMDLTPLDRVFLAARQGDPEVQRLLEKHAYYLGVAVAGLVNMFNPELILFGGIYAQGQDLLLPPLIRTVNQLAFSGLGTRVRMQATGFGWRAGVIGAAALGLMTFIYQQSDSFHR